MHKITGKKRAIVTNTVAPDNKMKAQVRVISEWDEMPDTSLPWAEYLVPLDRAFVPTKVGDLVWIEFPYDGDSRRPMIVGGANDWSGGIPNVPPEASGVGSQYQPPAKEGRPAEPAMTPTADMVMNRDGILIKRTQSGSYSITRTSDGTSIGFNDAGSAFIISQADTYLNATGNITILTDGNVTMKATGKMTLQAASMEIIAGSIDMKKG